MQRYKMRPSRRTASLMTVAAMTIVGASRTAGAQQPVVALETSRLSAFDAAGQLPGMSLAMDGDTLASGAPSLFTTGPPEAVYVYTRAGQGFVPQAMLQASDGVPGDGFGGEQSLALLGDRLAVGARTHGSPEYNAGAVYLFERSAGAWTQQARLQGLDTDWGDLFGDSVLFVDATTLAVGAINKQTPSTTSGGAVYVFEHDGTSWNQTAKLQPPDLANLDWFGSSLAFASDTLAVGARGQDAGAVYLYHRQGGNWSFLDKLTPGDAFPEYFGTALAMSSDEILVGTPGDYFHDDGHPGAVYVFGRNGPGFTQTDKLQAPAVTIENGFGRALTLAGSLLAVAAPVEFGRPGNGSAHVFSRVGSAWQHALEIAPCDDGPVSFSTSVAFEDGLLAAGDPFHEGGERGLFYVHTLSELADVGNTFCFGDGSGSACPCGNDSPNPGEGCLHSGGRGMLIAASGSTSIACDDLVVTAYQCVPGHTGIFFSGSATFPGIHLYDGLQCVGGAVLRYRGVFQTGGVVSDTDFVDQTPLGVYFHAGVTYNWQYWSRDTGPSPCGTHHNLSPGVRVTMSP